MAKKWFAFGAILFSQYHKDKSKHQEEEIHWETAAAAAEELVNRLNAN
jgi:hypothetical protein